MILQQLINGVSLGAVYALIAVGFALIFNILKFSNFSHGGVLVATAYAGYLITTYLKTNIWLTLVLTTLVGGILAVGIESLGFRRLRKNNGQVMLYFVSSITIGMFLENLMTIFFSSNFYSYPNYFKKPFIEFAGLNIAIADLIMLCISAAALGILMFVIYKTRLGIAIRALSMDAKTTTLMGINVSFVIAATFFASGALGALGGVFLGINYTLYPQLGQLIVKGFIASVIGGLGSIYGAVVGAVLLGVLEVQLIGIDFIGSGLSPVVTFGVLLLFLLLRPQGIAGHIVSEKV